MKKLLFSAFTALAFGSSLQSQSIDISNFYVPPVGADIYHRAMVSSVSTANPGSNQTWDYSNLIPTTIDSLVYFDAKDSINGYPDVYNYRYQELESPSGGAIDGYEFYNLNASGFYVAAFYVDAYSENLAVFTGGANDALVIPQQRQIFQDSLHIVRFPVNAQSSWSDANNRIVNFNLTVSGFGLNQAPGYFKNTDQQTRTVVGEGQIIIPDEMGNVLAPVDVYMIDVLLTSTDSIFLGGLPAPPALMNAFGLTQGASSTQHFVVFYAKNGSGYPIVSYNLDGLNNIVGFFYRPYVARNALGIGLEENLTAKIQVYPNPIQSGETLSIALENENDLGQIEILSLNGQLLSQINRSEIATSGKQINILPPAHPGLYLVQIKNQNGEVLKMQKIQVL
ncbi:T9SS type A sorting domain-containing protein [Croceimicrobium sp.]|uniref:T9SS type A sorting domain-containing protein n=1 Tax=Croceimicrobium sp. TaxID=2828340 RepID=UPI003BAA9100